MKLTKQQQQKIDKVNKALDLMSKGKTIREVYAEVGYSRWDKLKRALQELDYIEVDGKWVKSNTECTTESNTERNTGSNTKCTTESNTECTTECTTSIKQELSITSKQTEVLSIIEREQETIIEMLEWYKSMRNTGSNTSTTFMSIELPESENTMISSRSNKVVWKMFNAFCKENYPTFKQGDLLAKALMDFMERYKR